MFTKQQRGGIFLLIVVIIVLQSVYYFVDFSSENYNVNQKALAQFEAEVDSLSVLKRLDNLPKIYPFNPNYITDYKGYTLGLSASEIDRLHDYRKTNKWVNSAKEFQSVTQISDSLLEQIAPYFKFPEWVTNPKPNYRSQYATESIPKKYEQKNDLNTATATQLQRVNGIGETLSERIVNYRARSGGFAADVQLQEVYGLSPEVITRVLAEFTVKSGKTITKININSATIDQLVSIKYIDYEIAHNIIEQRTLREGFKSFEELTKVKDFPVKKSEIIALYLTFE
ncbi:competence protein ComEA helix-hairpin-helix repeat region [Formosa sp. Hel1_31_208]|uniref:ComEA family DNA-binding protein n=1 Tax=Formosa sp. Hel1_31_208 TaxID=1798225 RepID=UPI000879C5CA|nr:helix-hairpin-helix domain-containing protein [Formosa sp. Hel1_31_208]SDR99024.1 competence protein ComEA helix-hairpin-helix repeat region [Formosa sp. Hel1_31_208]